MRKTFITLTLLITSTIVPGQVASAISALSGLAGKPSIVMDPTNKAQLVHILNETRKSYSVVKQQLELLDQAREAVNKVNTFVKQYRIVNEIAEIQRDIFEMNKASMEAAQSMKVISANEVIDYLTAINTNLIYAESSLNLVNAFLSDNVFEMTTKERLEMLYELKREAQSYRATARYLDRQIRHYATLEFMDRIYTTAGIKSSYYK
ncbi:MAG: hypothetical protein AAGA64_08690 [Bacteroidota bacterium]